MTHEDDQTSGDSVRRRAPRAGIVLQLGYRSTSHLLISYCTNLSRGGLFVPTTEPLPPKTKLTLSLAIPGSSIPAELVATVRWVRQIDAPEGPRGMGLAFDDIDHLLGDQIDSLVSQFAPLRVELVGARPESLGHVAGLVGALVSCNTHQHHHPAGVDPAKLDGADLVVIELGADPEPALALLRQVAGRRHAPPRIVICDARPELWSRAIPYARVIGVPIETDELRTAVLESVAQVEALAQTGS